MKTNSEKADEAVVKLKELMNKLPVEDRMFTYWILLRDSLKGNNKSIVWVYFELGRLMERNS